MTRQVADGERAIDTETYHLILGAGCYVLACVGLLADAVGRRFSRSQMEDILDERRAGRLTRFFCRPFLQNADAFSLSCSILSIGFCGLYFIYGMWRWSESWGSWRLGGALLLPLLGAGIILNILARLRTEETLLALSRPLWFLTLPLRSAAGGVNALEDRIFELFHNGEEDDEEDREEIIAAVTDGEHEGVVQENEREMIVNIFDLKRFDISDIMTPRTDICAINLSASVEDAIHMAQKKGFSRIPVFHETRDDIRGIFYVKDILRLWDRKGVDIPPLKDALREPFFVPETKNVQELMAELQQRKMHMAIVLDEYGGTAGLVTIEDILEEIVGEIQDEYDPEENVLISPVGEGAFEVDARLHVHDMNEALDEKVIPEEDDFETIGGFVLDQFGHMPEAGETFLWEGYRFRILAAEERKVERVRVEAVAGEDDSAPEDSEKVSA